MEIIAGMDVLALGWMDFFDEIKVAFEGMLNDFAKLLPRLVLAAIIVLIGYAFAKLLARLIMTSFEKLGLDDFLKNSGVTGVFERMGFRSSPGKGVSKFLFWVILLFTAKVAAEKAGIEDLSLIVVKVIEFMPNALTALLIMLVGYLVADFLRSTVYHALNTAGLDYARTLSKVLFGFVFIIVLTVALAQVSIETELLNASVQIILAAVGLAMALALGLGLKGMARSIVSGVYSRDLYRKGTEIEFEGETVIVAGVGPVTTKLLRQDGGFIVVPNEKLITEPVRGRSVDQ